MKYSVFTIFCSPGRVAQDEAAFLEMGRAALNGANLPEEVEAFLSSLCARPIPAPESTEPATPPDPAQATQAPGTVPRAIPESGGLLFLMQETKAVSVFGGIICESSWQCISNPEGL